VHFFWKLSNAFSVGLALGSSIASDLDYIFKFYFNRLVRKLALENATKNGYDSFVAITGIW